MSPSLPVRMLVLMAAAASAGSVHAEYSITDLVGAARRGDAHAVHRLVGDGVDLDTRDADGYTALHWAAIRAHWRIVAELVAAGAPVNAVGGDGGTPLHWACHHDRPDMVSLLVDAGADIDLQNRWGRSPLHVAARRGCFRVATLLLEHGANPDAVTVEGWTPLYVAQISDHPEVVDLLLAHGGDPEHGEWDGLTADASRRPRQPLVDVDPATFDDLAGLYDLGDGVTVKVWRDGDTLELREFATDTLEPVGRDVFRCRQEPWRVEFLRDETGAVDAIRIEYLRRTVEGARLPSPRYVGSRACMACHSSPDRGAQYMKWLQSRHGHAYWRLAADWALYLGRLRPQYQDLVDPTADERCLLCHVTGAQDEDALFAGSFRAEEGVGCESCHGPGSDYIDPETMADREAFLAHGGRLPDESTCRTCHRRSENFSWNAWWPKIEHPRPPVEAQEKAAADR